MEPIEINPIFLALTKPPMMLGVTVDYLMMTGMFSFILFMFTHRIALLLVFIPLYVAGWAVCYQDANQFKVLMTRVNAGFSPLKSSIGCHSYAPY